MDYKLSAKHSAFDTGVLSLSFYYTLISYIPQEAKSAIIKIFWKNSKNYNC